MGDPENMRSLVYHYLSEANALASRLKKSAHPLAGAQYEHVKQSMAAVYDAVGGDLDLIGSEGEQLVPSSENSF